MTARLSLVLEKPEKTFSTSLLAFSFIKRPSLVKNPLWLAKHLNRVGLDCGLNRVLGMVKKRLLSFDGGDGFERSER